MVHTTVQGRTHCAPTAQKKTPRSGSESLPLTRACCPNSKESKRALAGEELHQPTLVVAWECVRRSVNSGKVLVESSSSTRGLRESDGWAPVVAVFAVESQY